jgi:enoyl-CoA hydratase / 3-hydroxyacyl-CoA dehydrogenase
MQQSNSAKVLVIVGAGFMGQGIARSALGAGFTSIILHDSSAVALEKAFAVITDTLGKLNACSERVAGCEVEILKEQDLAVAIKDADFIIEATPEIMELKQRIFSIFGRQAPLHCVFATNTSTMSIDEIALFSDCKDRVIGMHFFVPEESRLIEITKGAQTSELTLSKTLAVANRLPCTRGPRMTVVLERWSPGFIVNRSTAPVVAYLNWVIDRAMEKGISAQQIDAQMEAVMPGFYKTMDFIGLDIVYQTCRSFAETLSPDLGPGCVLADLVRQGHLGQKTGKGFYRYPDNGEPVCEDGSPDVSSMDGLMDLELIMAVQFNECCRIVEEGILSDFNYVDECILAAINTPGPCSTGLEHHSRWCSLLNELSNKTGKPYFKPCNLMASGDFRR